MSLLLAGLLGLGAPTLAAVPPGDGAEISTASIPAWVEVLPVERSQGDAPEGTVDILLFDTQDNAALAPVESFTRVVKEVLNEQGVQYESQIEVDFDPSYQEVVFHEVVIHRGGQRLDRLDPEAIRVIQREQQLELQVYDGQRTALIFLEDVRVGDVIEFAYTRRGRSPVFGERYFGAFLTGYQVPVRRIRRRILLPEGRELLTLNHGTEVEPEVRSGEGRRELVWDLREVPAQLVDDAVPSWFDSLPWVQVSEYGDWAQVAAWGEELFRVGGQAQGEVRELVAALRAEAEDPHELVRLALRTVQRDVRYLGIVLGEGAHRPSAPDAVLARRYGDCKDKALLLTAVLAELGVPARPALVNTTALHTVADQLPTPGAFDHVIVRATVGDDEVWMDPTYGSERGPLNERSLPDYGVALVLEPGARGLVEVRRDQGEPPHTTIEKSFRVQTAGPSRLTIETTYEGSDANGVRLGLESMSTDELSSRCVNYLAQEYPSIVETSRPVVVDREDENRIVVREEYSLPDIWQPDSEGGPYDWASFYCAEMSGELARPGSTRRTSPFALPHPRFVTYRIVADLPDEWEITPEHTTVENPAFHLDRVLSYASRRLSIQATYHTLADHVPARDLGRYVADLERADGLLGYEISNPRAGFAGAEIPDDVALVIGVLVLGFGAFVAVAGAVVYLLVKLRRPAPAPAIRFDPEPDGGPPAYEPPSALPGRPAPADPSPFARGASPGAVSTLATAYARSTGVAAPPARVAPLPLQPAPAPPQVWREGRTLVFEREAELPQRCYRCNAPAEHRRTVRVWWHSRWWYLLILAGLVVYALVALIVVKRAKVELGSCRRHHRRRILAMWGNAVGVLGGFGTLFLPFEYSALTGLGMLGMLCGVLNAVRLSSSVRAVFIDERIVQLRGMGRPYLDSL